MKTLILITSLAFLSFTTVNTDQLTEELVTNPRYGSLTIENDTGALINYSYKWGNSSWESYCISPGEVIIHSYPYSNGSCYSPDFEIDFDFVLGDCYINSKNYGLDRYAVSNSNGNGAKEYVFRTNSIGNRLDLYSQN